MDADARMDAHAYAYMEWTQTTDEQAEVLAILLFKTCRYPNCDLGKSSPYSELLVSETDSISNFSLQLW